MARPKYAQKGVVEEGTGTASVPTTPPIPDHLRGRHVPLTENARKVLERRYLRKGPDGAPVETIPEMFWRVAWHVAAAEEVLGGDREAWAERFYRMLTALEFLPNSPTFTGAGTPLGQLAACFVLPIEDDMGKVRGGIFDTLLNAALIQQTGGGNGFSFSRLRPLGEHVISSAGKATGPVGFLRVYDKAFGEIAQGGCLVPETLVFTDRGLLRLDELVDSRVRGWQPHRLRVATDEGWRRSPHGYNNGVAPVVRVRTRAGIGITGTPEHKVKVMTEVGPVWRALEALRPGDRLLVRLGQHRGELQTLRHPHDTGGTLALPARLDEALAFFAGYVAGRGRVVDGGRWVEVRVPAGSEMAEALPALVEHLFGLPARRRAEGDKVVCVVDHGAVGAFLRLNALHPPEGEEAAVPPAVRRSPPAVVGAYLCGLFEAAGTLSRGWPAITVPSPRMADEVAALLIGLGCPVHIVAGEEEVAPSARLLVRLQTAAGWRAWQERVVARRPALAAARQHDAGSSPPARPVADAVSSKNPLAFPEGAGQEPSPDGLWPVEVVGVEPAGEALTLDLEVEGNHTYLAYGVVTHNTRRGANMAVLRVDHPDIREFVRCKAQEGEITNFNISVAITDDFMRAVERDEEWALCFPDVHHPAYRTFRGTIDQARRAGLPIKVYERVRARELFDEIVRHAHHNGEPGVLFIDRANRDNPVPHLYDLEATNPCVTGETPVATPKGWRPVAEIEPGDEIYTADGRVRRVERVEIYHRRPVYRVTFSDGGTLRATAAHQFHVWDEVTGRFIPVPLLELTEGTQVRVHRPFPLRLPLFAGQGRGEHELPAARDEVVEIVHVEYDGVETVYDLYEPVTDTWLPAGYVSRGCGEQWLGPYENCCLGSVNLARHLAWEEGRARLDWEKLAETVRVATRFLDDVVTANKYVAAVPELREAAEQARRIGLGIMGLADVLYALRVRYGSKEGQELAAQIMEWVRYHAMLTSVELARERGPFPAIDGSIYDPNRLTWHPPTPLEPYTHDWGRPAVDWDAVVEGIRRHGIRNAAQTTIAPTGTLSTVSGVEGYGCEPVFALSYIRHVHEGDGVIDLYYFSPLFEQALTHEGVDEETRRHIKEKVALTGSCQDVAEVPEELRHVFVVAQDITPEEHVYMQAALQRFTDNAISKTVNFPEDATVEDVAKAYFLAWKLGCKGITVYVTGSREHVVLETKKTLLKKQQPQGADDVQPKARPRRLAGATYFTHTPLGKAYVTINRDPEGEPFEVFANVGKAGSDIAAVSEAIGRLISLILRLPSPMTPTQRLEEVIDQLAGIGGGRHLGFGANRILSLPDALARVLREDLSAHIGDGGAIDVRPGNGQPTRPVQPELFERMLKADLCPECGHASLVNEEGCRKCYSCGYSEC